jgi:3-dehydroquinate dehydratase II
VTPKRAASSKLAPLVVVLHGPNLNLLGTREPHIYGSTTLDEINDDLRRRAESLGLRVETFQSNHEGELVDRIQAARKTAAAMIINAGGYTHTSVALRDALSASSLPVIEVHLSNLATRESFRQVSLLSAVCVGQVLGLGAYGYQLAMDAAAHLIQKGKSNR